MGAVEMEPIKVYYNCYCYDYRDGAIGDMVTFEDHQAFVKEAMQQAFRDGFKAGKNIYITERTDEDRTV